LDKKNSTIIDPNDTLSSYILLKKATGVLSYGSTIGLEAAFNKIPSAVLADCWYDELGAVDRLSTFDEVISWMKTISAGMSEKELHDRYLRALIRGFWLERGGRNFTHSNLIELSWGAWKAQNSGLIRLDFRKVFVIISMLINRLKRRLGGLKN
jgi:hypothetical protein